MDKRKTLFRNLEKILPILKAMAAIMQGVMKVMIIFQIPTVGRIRDSTTEKIFLQMLLNSAEEGDSLFISWEPGRHGQYYFMTTKDLATRVAE